MMNTFTKIALLSILLASCTAAKDKSDANVTVLSRVSVDDGVEEMASPRRGDRVGQKNPKSSKSSKGGKKTYNWRRIATYYETGDSDICDYCDQEETCDNEDSYTAYLLEDWIWDNRGLDCDCSTKKSKAVGTQGEQLYCYSCWNGVCDCDCECTSSCDYKLECRC